MIPSWVKTRDEALIHRNKTLNAKSETVFERASFKQAILRRRCIVPVEAFYETQHRGKTKVPFEIRPASDDFFSLAGIWETWISPQTKTPVSGFSILTCEANQLMAEIHNTKLRMPVILGRDSERTWVDPRLTQSQIVELMKPCPVDWLQATPELITMDL